MSSPGKNADVAVWRWSLDRSTEEVAALARLLNEEERRQADRYVVQSAARRYTVTRGLVKQRLGATLGVEAEGVRFRYGPKGKPELVAGVGTPTIAFNVSHSAEVALCALANQSVGIDLERIRPMNDHLGMARRWFGTTELQRLETLTAEEQLAGFFRVWTAKESALKLIGLGVGEALPRISTPDDPRGGVVTGLPANPLGIDRCWVQPIDAGRGYVASLATALPPARVSVHGD